MLFDLTGKVAIITGGAGLLGREHAKAVAELGATVVLVDTAKMAVMNQALFLAIHLEDAGFSGVVRYFYGDITSDVQVALMLDDTLDRFGRIDILINNAAINSQEGEPTRFEDYSLEQWHAELSVGLTGAFLCSQIIGGYMAAHGGGVIVNIGSDFSHIAPDPRVYAPQVKPVGYSVVKHGIHGLTQYLAAYWADKGVRVNTLSPGGVRNGQPQAFADRIAGLVPMGRMAQPDEYHGAIQFLCSDASRFMTGQELILDGGRSVI